MSFRVYKRSGISHSGEEPSHWERTGRFSPLVVYNICKSYRNRGEVTLQPPPPSRRQWWLRGGPEQLDRPVSLGVGPQQALEGGSFYKWSLTPEGASVTQVQR